MDGAGRVQSGSRGGAYPFAHLSVHSCYSLRDGAIRPRELAAAAAAAGMSHIALTDRDGLYGAVRFARACETENVTPVFGADLALAPDLDRAGWEISRPGRHRRPASRSAGDPRHTRPGAGPGWLEDDAARAILLARNQTGYANLCGMISAAHDRRDTDGEVIRASPHLTWSMATVDPEGLYVLLGPDSPVGRLVAAGRHDAAAGEARRWVDAFGHENVLIGVRHHLAAGDDRFATHTLRLADRLTLTPVAVNDVRYLRADDAPLADVLACVREQVAVSDRHVTRTSAEGWFKTGEDLTRIPLFADRPDLLVNTQRVAETCAVDLHLDEIQVPRLTGLDPATAARRLHGRCESGLAERYATPVPDAVRGRLDAELAMIDELGLHDYFLAVSQIAERITEMGILSACRGSAAGSLVCYVTGISDVDPVANGLVFERFMNPHRDEPPDIDIDVESARREDVYRMVMDMFGERRTACVAMVETFRARMAVREVGKALGLPHDEIDLVAKALRHLPARDVRSAVDDLPELADSRLDAGQLDQLFSIVERIDGFPRHLALHPCGIVLGSDDLTARTPVERSANGFVMSQFDKDDVAALGLLKLDVLAVRLLSAMRHSLDLVPTTRGEHLDVDDIVAEDAAVYDLLSTTRSVGIFQVESPGQRELLGRLQPERFGDLITEISLFRPGPVKADMVSPYVARRHGDEDPGGLHPLLEDALAETHGVVVYHEQVMKVVAALTGCDLAEADRVRRELADESRVPGLKAWALRRARRRGIDQATATSIWAQVASFASFGFCKAHAAAFAVPTYRSAWLKAHYLPEFVAGLLTYDPGMYPRRLLLDEARQFGVAVLGPDVNVSAAGYTVEAIEASVADRCLGLRDENGRWRDPLPPGWRWSVGDRGIGLERGGQDSPEDATSEDGRAAAPTVASTTHRRPRPPSGSDAGGVGGDPRARCGGYRWAVRVGLQDVEGMRETELAGLVDNRPYTSVADLRRRGGLSRPTAANLVKAGALDSLCGLTDPVQRRGLLLEVEEFWAGRGTGQRTGRGGGRWTGRGAPRSVDDGRGSEFVEQQSFDLDADHDPDLPPASTADVVRDELAVLGLEVTRHVIAFYEPLLATLEVTRAVDLADQPDGAWVRVAGVRVALQSPPVRSGQQVLFVSLDDGTGVTQSNFFASVLERGDNGGGVARTLLHGWLVVVAGRVRRRGTHGGTVVGRRAWDLTELWNAWCNGRLETAMSVSWSPERRVRAPQRPAGLTAAMFASGSR